MPADDLDDDLARLIARGIAHRDEILARIGARDRAHAEQLLQDVPGLNEVMAELEGLGATPWMTLDWLTVPDAALGGRTAVEALRAGDLDAVLAVARTWGEMGG